jgi:hypothetical protein
MLIPYACCRCSSLARSGPPGVSRVDTEDLGQLGKVAAAEAAAKRAAAAPPAGETA